MNETPSPYDVWAAKEATLLPMADALPNSVRYVKNGDGGQWWEAAKNRGQIHGGWRDIPCALLLEGDMNSIERLVREGFGGRRGATQDFNALQTLLVRPSSHVWITFQDGFMWWCTVSDGIQTNPHAQTKDLGHFWLTCASPWSDHSLHGVRHLATTALPGIVTSTAGYRGTVCEPKGSREILRIIRNDEDADARGAALARQAYEDAIAKLIARLGDKDFEVLVDLILSRSGWARLAKVGGVTEGIDIEVENVVSDEIAFVQVKSTATQAVLDDYLSKFNARKERYDRMIFAVHTPKGALTLPSDQPISVWTGKDIAHRVVKLGLGDWDAARL
jgi:hypothetical protein